MNLNIGGGNWVFPFWRNIDYYAKEDFIDYKINLEENPMLPFKDDSVNMIYSSHLLEHITTWKEVLHECYRVLMPGHYLYLNMPEREVYELLFGVLHGITPIAIRNCLIDCSFFVNFVKHRVRHPIVYLPMFFNNHHFSFRLECQKVESLTCR